MTVFRPPQPSRPGDPQRIGNDTAGAAADHLHEREGAGLVGDVSQIDVGDAAAAGSSGRVAAADHQHPLPAPGTPTTVEVGDTGSGGSSAKVAREDHEHPVGSPGLPSASAVGDSGSAGTSAKPAREDHDHPREGFGSVTAATTTATATNGANTTVIRSDHDHGWPTDSPRGFRASANIASNSSTVTAEAVVSGLSLTINPVGTNRLLRIEFTGRVNTDTVNNLVILRLRNGTTTGGTQLARGQTRLTATGGPGQQTVTFFAVGTFSGSQSFCVTLESSTGNALVAAESSSPALLLVSDLGA